MRGIGAACTGDDESRGSSGRRQWWRERELGLERRAVEDKTASSSWRIRASGGRARHDSRGWPACVPGLAGGGTTRAVRRRTEQGGGREGEADRRARRGKNLFLFFLGL